MKAQSPGRHDTDLQTSPAAASRYAGRHPAMTVPDNRPEAAAHRSLTEAVRNSPRMAVQREQLQGMFPHAALLQRSSDKSAGSVFQRKIHLKSGWKYDGADSLGHPKARSMAAAEGIYLMQSDADVAKMERGEDAPALAPKRHLIGEVHNNSRFRDAVSAWGWGAELLIEAYSQHEKLKNPAQTAKQGSSSTQEHYDEMWAKAKGLENTAVSGLTDLINAQNFGATAVTLAQAFRSHESVFSGFDKANLKLICKGVWDRYGSAAQVAKLLQDYVQESRVAHGISGRYFSLHEQIEPVVTEDLVQRISEGRLNIQLQYLEPNTLHLDPAILEPCNLAIRSLVPLVRGLIVAYDPGVVSPEEIDQISGEANRQKSIDPLDSLREKFMARNIAAARIPALVKIGGKHVRNLSANLPAESIPYEDYAAFEAKNTAKNVDV